MPENRYLQYLINPTYDEDYGVSPPPSRLIFAGAAAGAALLFLRTPAGHAVLRRIAPRAQGQSLVERKVLELYYARQSLANTVRERIKDEELASRIIEAHFKTLNQEAAEYLERQGRSIASRLTGARPVTVGEILDRKVPFEFRPFRMVVPPLGDDVSSIGFAEQAPAPAMEMLLRTWVKERPDIRNLPVDPRVLVNRQGEIIDLRGFNELTRRLTSRLSDISIPIVNWNIGQIFRIDLIREIKDRPQFAFIPKGSVQPFFGGAMQEDLFLLGRRLVSLRDPGKVIAEGVYAAPFGTPLRAAAIIQGVSGDPQYKTWIHRALDLGAQPDRSWVEAITSIFRKKHPLDIRSLSDNILSGQEIEGSARKIIEILASEPKSLPREIWESDVMRRAVQRAYGGLFPEGRVSLDTQEDLVHTLFQLISSNKMSRRFRKTLWNEWKSLSEFPDVYFRRLRFSRERFPQLPYLNIEQVISTPQEEWLRSILQQEIRSYIRQKTGSIPFDLMSDEAIKNSALRRMILAEELRSARSSAELLDMFHKRGERSARLREVLRLTTKEIAPWFAPSFDPRSPSRAMAEQAKGAVLMREWFRPPSFKEIVRAARGDRDAASQVLRQSELFVRQFFAGRKDPSRFTTASLFPYYSMLRLNDMFSMFGLGLSERSMGSAQQIFFNLLSRRYLAAIAAVGYAGYLSWEIENFTGFSPKKAFFDTLAGLNIAWAKLMNITGITSLTQRMTEVMPGSELFWELPVVSFFDPRWEADELAEFLREGTAPVRKGRWWPYSSMQGGPILYYWPSWYRRFTTDWEFTDVLWGEREEAYRNWWLPTPRFPASPIRHFITDPYHLEEMWGRHRPYPVSGPIPAFSNVPIIGPALNATIGRLLKPPVRMYEEEMAAWEAGLAETGASPLSGAASVVEVTPAGLVRLGLRTHPLALAPEGYEAIEEGGSIRAQGARRAFGPAFLVALDRLAEGQTRLFQAPEYTGEQSAASTATGIRGPALFAALSQIFSIHQGIIAEDQARSVVIRNRRPLEFALHATPQASNLLEGNAFRFQAAEAFSQATDILGLYGFMLRSALGVANRPWEDIPRLATPERVTSLGRWHAELQIGGFPGELCLTPDTLLQSDWGSLIRADEIKPGDILLSRYGRPQRVLATSKRPVKENIREVICVGAAVPLRATEEHPIWAVRAEYCEHKDKRKNNFACVPSCVRQGTCSTLYFKEYEPEWIPIKFLKRGDYIAYPVMKLEDFQKIDRIDVPEILAHMEFEVIGDRIKIKGVNNNRTFPHDVSLNWKTGKLFGLFLAEGSFGGKGRNGRHYEVHFSFAEHEHELIGHVVSVIEELGLSAKVKDIPHAKAVNVNISSTILSELLLALFGKTKSKRIPAWLAGAPREFLLGMLEGIFKGDGHAHSYGIERVVELQWTAYEAASQVFNLLIALGFFPTLSEKKGRTCKGIDGRPINGSSALCVRLYGDQAESFAQLIGLEFSGEAVHRDKNHPRTGMSSIWTDGTWIYFPVKENRPVYYEGYVYDFHMNGDPSFITLCHAVHNSEVGRRFLPSHRRYDPEVEINPIRNLMPSWMPGSNYFINFKEGDQYAKIPHGEYRLPGPGYERMHGVPSLEERLEAMFPDPNARSVVQSLIEQGYISPYETYSAWERFKILADVAPWSEEYKYYEKLLTESKELIPPTKLAEFQKIKKQVSQVKKRERFFPYRFRHAQLEYHNVTVRQVINNNVFLVDEFSEPIRLAGVYVPQGQDEAGERARRELARFIYPGARITIGIAEDPLRRTGSDQLESTRAVVIAGELQLNRYLIDQGIASERPAEDPASIHVRFSPREIAIGSIWERFAHLDTPIHTTFLQVRSPLEMYERKEVFGKNWRPWWEPVSSILVPTLESFARHSPLVSAGYGYIYGRLATLMSRDRAFKHKAGLVGAGLLAGLSTLRMLYEGMTGETWIPKRRRLEREVEMYFSALEYLKYRGIYEFARRRALEEEGFDVERLYEEAEAQGQEVKRLRRELEALKRELVVEGSGISEERLFEIHARIQMMSQTPVEPEHQAMIRSINERLRSLGERRSEEEIGPWSQLAIQARERYQSTIWGMDVYGHLEHVIRALPRKDRIYITEFLKAPESERQRILEITPIYVRRVLQAHWGMEPESLPDLAEFFSGYWLPPLESGAWSPAKSLEDLKVKVVESLGLELTEFGLWGQDVKKAKQNQAPLIPWNRPSAQGVDLERKLKEIMEGQGLEDVWVRIKPSHQQGISMMLNINRNPSEELREFLLNNPYAVFGGR